MFLRVSVGKKIRSLHFTPDEGNIKRHAVDRLVCFLKKTKSKISLKLVPNPTNESFLESLKVKPTMATSGSVTILLQY